MSNETSSIESDLLKLRAALPDEALIARLEACTAGTWTQLTAEETALESNLRSLRPAPLSSSLLAALETAVQDVDFPAEPTLIPFPARAAEKSQSNRKWWAAAAAVALIGALTALIIPDAGNQEIPDVAVASKPLSTEHHPKIDSNQLVPAGFNRDLRDARDEGVVWQSGQKAHRVLRVVYLDRVTLKSADGKSYEVEQPRVEYILTPEQAD